MPVLTVSPSCRNTKTSMPANSTGIASHWMPHKRSLYMKRARSAVITGTVAMMTLPVAAVTAGKAGGKNAALYAIEILALSDPGLKLKLQEFRVSQRSQVVEADEKLQQELFS